MFRHHFTTLLRPATRYRQEPMVAARRVLWEEVITDADVRLRHYLRIPGSGEVSWFSGLRQGFCS